MTIGNHGPKGIEPATVGALQLFCRRGAGGWSVAKQQGQLCMKAVLGLGLAEIDQHHGHLGACRGGQ